MQSLRKMQNAFEIIKTVVLTITDLERAANGVNLILSVMIPTTIPGASFSRIDFVASGVTSRSVNPVPPVVKTMST